MRTGLQESEHFLPTLPALPQPTAVLLQPPLPLLGARRVSHIYTHSQPRT